MPRSRIDPTSYTILVWFAEKKRFYWPSANEFYFTKADFLRTYRLLLREKLVDWMKYETLTRNLRDYASSRMCVSYADTRGGKYIGEISCLELDSRYHRVREKVTSLLAQVRA